MQPRLFPIDGIGIDQTFLVEGNESIAGDGTKEQGGVAFVASGAGLLNGEEEVSRRNRCELGELFGGGAFFAFSPMFIAAAAEIGSHTGAESFFEGLAVHPGEHEDLPGGGILGDSGQ